MDTLCRTVTQKPYLKTRDYPLPRGIYWRVTCDEGKKWSFTREKKKTKRNTMNEWNQEPVGS